MDLEAGIHGSGGGDPRIRRLGPMDPEAGIHGSGHGHGHGHGRPAGSGRPAPAGRPVGRPRPAPAGRPGGRVLKEHKVRKRAKSPEYGSGFVMSSENVTPVSYFRVIFRSFTTQMLISALFPLLSTFDRFEPGKS